jgi:hypothetical protein
MFIAPINKSSPPGSEEAARFFFANDEVRSAFFPNLLPEVLTKFPSAQEL